MVKAGTLAKLVERVTYDKYPGIYYFHYILIIL
jgi:hypothetical protein